MMVSVLLNGLRYLYVEQHALIRGHKQDGALMGSSEHVPG